VTPPTALEPTGLLGAWAFDRTIDDRHGAESSTVDGTSELALQDDGRIRWSERGTLHRATGDVPVSRVLFIEPHGDLWWVTFDDGRDFHPWTTGEEVVHPCVADTYVGRIEADGSDRWTVEWRVSGPAKDYTMTTVLTRHAS
jgi:hypothetical protein